MRDCANGRMRDLLPDLLHDRLPSTLRAEVERHVAECEACRAELGLLRQVLVAMTVAPLVDSTRIATAIPPYRVLPVWRRSVASPLLRVAAAVLLLAGGSVLVLRIASRDRTEPPASRTAAIPTPSAPVAAQPSSPEIVGATAPARHPSAAHSVAELAVGESFHDLSEAELRELLDEVGKLDAVTSSETEIVVPAPGPERGGT